MTLEVSINFQRIFLQTSAVIDTCAFILSDLIANESCICIINWLFILNKLTKQLQMSREPYIFFLNFLGNFLKY